MFEFYYFSSNLHFVVLFLMFWKPPLATRKSRSRSYQERTRQGGPRVSNPYSRCSRLAAHRTRPTRRPESCIKKHIQYMRNFSFHEFEFKFWIYLGWMPGTWRRGQHHASDCQPRSCADCTEPFPPCLPHKMRGNKRTCWPKARFEHHARPRSNPERQPGSMIWKTSGMFENL